MPPRLTLFIAGLGQDTRQSDLAFDSELTQNHEYFFLFYQLYFILDLGPWCDAIFLHQEIAPQNSFVEFEDPLDAEDAYNEMHGAAIDGHRITIQVRIFLLDSFCLPDTLFEKPIFPTFFSSVLFIEPR
ncbi:hypothetical protein AYI68_g5733 [Smittium mucronatum]|uniref:RRM domain-containing protein n=1 Tax=Smittium mucronatum TaxID=133383 RepID=A0A1R0GTF0_9FUNG|nr:hypothetical protein AYI68_g5733 [Smittium mucronatum]